MSDLGPDRDDASADPSVLPGALQKGAARRDFLYLTARAMGAVGAAGAGWVLVDSMNPPRDAPALSSIEVDLGSIGPGQAITVSWLGKPVFVRSRTEQEVAQARAIDIAALPDPQPDADRVKKPEWLVVIGICTHLGCVPLGQKAAEPRGEFGGYLCPCHGSQFDTSARVRKGPAPKNLVVPDYAFLSDKRIRIG